MDRIDERLRERLKAERHELRARVRAHYAAIEALEPDDPRFADLLRRLAYDRDLPRAFRDFLDMAAERARRLGNAEEVAIKLDEGGLFESRVEMMRWIVQATENRPGE